MHLYVPTYVSTFGKWSYDAQRYAWAVFPLGADWLFTYTFVLGGEMAAKLFNLAVGSATTWLLYLRLRQAVPVSWACLLTAACMSAPMLVLLSASLLVENTLMFFMLAGLLLVDRLDARWRSWLALWILVAALCSIKLQGAIFAAALTLVALWRALRSGQARPPILAWALSVPLSDAGAATLRNGVLDHGQPALSVLQRDFQVAIFCLPAELCRSQMGARLGARQRLGYDVSIVEVPGNGKPWCAGLPRVDHRPAGACGDADQADARDDPGGCRGAVLPRGRRIVRPVTSATSVRCFPS